MIGRTGRCDYAMFRAITTRWMDNDAFAHVNNVYYSFFDTAVTGLLVDGGGLDAAAGAAIGVVVETRCRFHRSIAFPDVVHAGLRVERLGRTSVRYAIGLFRNDEEEPAADGHFVHVYVDRATRRPVEVPPEVRTLLMPLIRARELSAPT